MRRIFPVVLLLLLALCIPAPCQETTGTISGTIQDPTGAVVPGATVTITNTDTNIVVRALKSGETGTYAAPLLPIGHYSVAAEAPGFRKSVLKNITLTVSDKLLVNVTLQIGATADEVTVEANPLHVELQSTAAAGLISGTQLRELSLNNRNYEQLVALQPGVTTRTGDQLYIGVSNPSGQTNTVNFSLNGSTYTQNNWTVDGADNVDRGSNGTLLVYPSVDAIAEFKVLRGMYNPEYGRAAGGQINVITKSGTDTFHGGIYEFFRNDVLNANTFFNNRAGIKRPPLRYNNFGGTIGGPLYIPGVYNKDRKKTFFFFSQEFRRVKTYATWNAYGLPSDAMKNGTFANPVCIAFDATGACTQTGTQIANIDPAASAYIKDVFSKIAQPQNLADFQLTSAMQNIFNYREEIVRIDHVFGPRLTVTGRFMDDSIPTVEPGGLFGPNTYAPGVATSSTNSPGRNFMIHAVATINQNTLLDVGYAYSYGAIVSRLTGSLNPKNSPEVAAAITLPFKPTLARIPTIGFADGETLAGFGPYDDFNRNHNWYGNFTRIMGHHTLKMGLSWNKYNKSENAGGNNPGTFTFYDDGVPTGTSSFEQEWANFLLGRAGDFTQNSMDLTPDIHQNHIEWYFQDEWRVFSNLTLTYGVRHSMFRQPTESHGLLTNFDPNLYDPAKAPQIDAATGNIIPGTGDPLNGIIQGGKNSPYGDGVAKSTNYNFAPRLGFAWDPFRDGKTSIRGGYGMFWDAPSAGIGEDNVFANPPYNKSVFIGATTFTNPGSVSADVNNSPNYLQANNPSGKLGYIQSWNLDVQREFGAGMLVDIGYYGSKGTHLNMGLDINEVPPGAALAAGIIQPGGYITSTTTPLLNAIRPYRGYEAIMSVEPRGKSSYNSLQMSFQKRFKDNSLINVNYTWSHSLSNFQWERWWAAQNVYDLSKEWGPSYLDRRHAFTANFVYEIPFFRAQQGAAGRVLGGWELSGIITANSGLGLTPGTRLSRDYGALGILANGPETLRPNMVSNPNVNAPHTLDEFFNTSAFANVSGVNLPGNARRGSITGPGFQRWDLSLFKNIKITERVSTQFRAEAFNVWNHTNFDGVGTSLGSSSFGKVTSTRDPRIVQLGLKLNF